MNNGEIVTVLWRRVTACVHMCNGSPQVQRKGRSTVRDTWLKTVSLITINGCPDLDILFEPLSTTQDDACRIGSMAMGWDGRNHVTIETLETEPRYQFSHV